MPSATNRGVTLYYETDGAGDAVAFISDVGAGAWLWAWQAPALAGPYRTLVWDTRGVGRSDAPPGPYTMAGMAADLEAVLADAEIPSATLVGAGFGGMVALEYARSYGRADRLVLMGTTAEGSRMDAEAMTGDPEATDVLFSEAFVDSYPDEVARIIEWRRREDADPEAAAAQRAAIGSFDVSGRLHEIAVPALVMHGTNDAVVPVAAGEALADGLPRGRLERYEDEAHFFFVEQSRLVTDALFDFLGAG